MGWVGKMILPDRQVPPDVGRVMALREPLPNPSPTGRGALPPSLRGKGVGGLGLCPHHPLEPRVMADIDPQARKAAIREQARKNRIAQKDKDAVSRGICAA